MGPLPLIILFICFQDMHRVEAARFVVASKHDQFVGGRGSLLDGRGRVVASWFGGGPLDLGSLPDPTHSVQDTDRVEPFGTLDSAKKNQFVGIGQQRCRVTTATRGNITRYGWRIPEHNVRIQNLVQRDLNVCLCERQWVGQNYHKCWNE
jgi:hypothetical protein